MFDAYYPNSLRLEQFENIGTIMDFKPTYGIRFDTTKNDHFQALQAMNLSILLEGLLLYDRIYIDVLEFPLYIAEMAVRDLSSTVTILRNGWISFLNMPDVRPFLQYSTTKNSYTWIAAGHSYEGSSAVESIQSGLSHFIKDPYILHSIEECIPMVSTYSKSITGRHDVLGKKLCDTIDNELKAGCYKSLGIGVLGQYYITEKNKNIFFHIGNVISGDMRAKEAGITNVIRTDLQESLAKQRYIHYNVIPDNFEKVLHLNKLPDFKQEILAGHLTLKNVIALRESPSFVDFSKWLRSNSENGSDIAQEFVESIKNPASSSLKWKWGRLITTTGLGSIPVVGSLIGIGAGLVDTFVLDQLIDRHEPKIFIENLQKKISGDNNDKNSPHVVSIPVDNTVLIDNSKEVIENLKQTDQALLEKVNQMKACKQEEEQYQIYKEAMKTYDKYPHSDLTVRFLYLNYLLASNCPKYMELALHRLDNFLDSPPFKIEDQNLFIVAKYYFGSMHNAFVNYKLNPSVDKEKFECQNYHCAKITFPSGAIEVLKENLVPLYDQVRKTYGI